MQEQSMRWRSSDIEAFPDDGKLYEIIDGELYVSRQPSWEHQVICATVTWSLKSWSRLTGNGSVAIAPGLLFSEDGDVAPDVVWVSSARLPAILGPDRKLHDAPELVVEVLSPGPRNDQRDREAKLRLYGRRGVREYWVVNWQLRQVELYRRERQALTLVATLVEGDSLESPLLHGYSLSLSELFADLP